MRPVHHLALAVAGIVSLCAMPARSGTQQFIYPLSPFSSTDQFTYTLNDVFHVPQFHPIAGVHALKYVTVGVVYGPGSPTYKVTNTGMTTDFGVLKTTHGLVVNGPAGSIFGAPFGMTGGGPPINPGQSALVSAYVGASTERQRGFNGAQPYSGLGTVDISVAIDEVITINAPNFTAEYVSGNAESGTLKVRYDYVCAGDSDDDNIVNINDLIAVINHWGVVGSCSPNIPCLGDTYPLLYGNGVVNIDDLLMVINHWGTCPAPG
jgi:hypothetical protein